MNPSDWRFIILETISKDSVGLKFYDQIKNLISKNLIDLNSWKTGSSLMDHGIPAFYYNGVIYIEPSQIRNPKLFSFIIHEMHHALMDLKHESFLKLHLLTIFRFYETFYQTFFASKLDQTLFQKLYILQNNRIKSKTDNESEYYNTRFFDLLDKSFQNERVNMIRKYYLRNHGIHMIVNIRDFVNDRTLYPVFKTSILEAYRSIGIAQTQLLNDVMFYQEMIDFCEPVCVLSEYQPTSKNLLVFEELEK